MASETELFWFHKETQRRREATDSATLGRKQLEIENPKKSVGAVSCSIAHSQARELVTQGYTATLVVNTLMISRSSLYYRKHQQSSRADRTYDEQIVAACGEKTSNCLNFVVSRSGPSLHALWTVVPIPFGTCKRSVGQRYFVAAISYASFYFRIVY